MSGKKQTRNLKNIHPGEILLEEFLLPLKISQNRLARDMQIPPRRINEIVQRKRGITADTDLRLSRALGTSEGFWLGLQTDYELEERKNKIGALLREISNLAPLKKEHRGGILRSPPSPVYFVGSGKQSSRRRSKRN